jgi:uncharacterized protein YjeT (DUF2065 family)
MEDRFSELLREAEKNSKSKHSPHQWDIIQGRINQNSKLKNSSNQKIWIKVAAVFFVLVLSGFILYFYLPSASRKIAKNTGQSSEYHDNIDQNEKISQKFEPKPESNRYKEEQNAPQNDADETKLTGFQKKYNLSVPSNPIDRSKSKAPVSNTLPVIKSDDIGKVTDSPPIMAAKSSADKTTTHELNTPGLAAESSAQAPLSSKMIPAKDLAKKQSFIGTYNGFKFLGAVSEMNNSWSITAQQWKGAPITQSIKVEDKVLNYRDSTLNLQFYFSFSDQNGDHFISNEGEIAVSKKDDFLKIVKITKQSNQEDKIETWDLRRTYE